jgi:predicted aspartyl protease
LILRLAAALLLLQAAPSAAQPAWPEDCKLHRIASFPMTLRAGHVLVPVTVNDKTENFIVDTGGYATSITENAAAGLGLTPRRTAHHVGRDLGGNFADSVVTVSTFGLGSMQAHEFDLIVMAANNNEDGLLAPDLLRNFDVEFDFAAGTLNLFRPHPCNDRAVYWTRQYISLPVTTAQQLHVRVPVTLDGQDIRAILDTGAPMSVISMESAGHLFGLDGTNPSVTATGAMRGASGGVVATFAYPFKALTMAGVNVANPRILIGEGGNFLAGNEASLLLGMDVLRKLHLHFAYHESKLYVSAADAH